jgi:hypothetical protein
MIYGRVIQPHQTQSQDGAAVSHSAELVRGYFPSSAERPPSSARLAEGEPPGRRAPSPQGEKGSIDAWLEKGEARDELS